MFDAKKLLDALGTPPTPAGAQPKDMPPAEAKPSEAKPTEAKPAEAKPAAPPAHPLGAGTLLSEIIGLANRPAPPPEPAPAASAEGDPPLPPKPPKPQQPADLTDLLLGKAQEYLKTPQGNAAMNAVVVGLTKAVVNSEAGRKLTASAKTRGTALFNRLLNRGAGAAPAIEGTAQAALPAQAAAPALLAPPEAPSGEGAVLVMRAMIAAAAADGRIDESERERILGTLTRAGIGAEGVAVIEAELAKPASVAELAAAVKTPGMAVQVYTAARRIITPNTVEERVFLAHLSGALGLDPRQVAQIDALASGAIQG